MRLYRTSVLAALAATTMLMGAPEPSLARETAQAAPAEAPIDPLAIGSFSGAYLAARTAEVEKDYRSATRYYERALQLDPDNEEVERSVFLGLLSTGQFDAALPLAEKLKLNREVSRLAGLTLGIQALREGQHEEAAQLLDAGLESDLDRLITGMLASWAHQGADNTDAALATLAALDGPPWYTLFVGYHSALIAEAGDRPDEARANFAAVLENQDAGAAAPDTYLRAAEAYARFLARQGDSEGALRVIDTADNFVTGRLPLQALREAIRSGGSVEPLIGSPAQGAAETLLNLATALNQTGGESFVRLYLQLARALNPASDMILLQLAGIAEQQQLPQEAIDLYGQIPADSPLKRAAELQIGLNLADLKRNDEAVEHLKLALDDDPDDMRAYLALGGVYAAEKRFDEAAKIYDRAVELLSAPVRSNWNIFYQRGIAYERLKQWDKAEPNFRKALELFPDQPQVLNYLGYSWVDMNMNLEEGLEMIKRAVELRPSDGYIVDSLGWAYYRMGRYEDAVRELERAVSLQPDDAVLNDHLGDAYWRVGRRLEATFQWSHAIDRKPEDAELAKIREKLASGLPDEPAPAAAKADGSGTGRSGG